MTLNTINFTSTLRQWRKQRKVSQLELSLAAEVSQRHISWLETGRSKPSREMVLKLCEALDIPLRNRNQLLNTAGFADFYSNKGLDEPEMAPVVETLERVLTHHEPYPAYVIDRYWNIKMKNQATQLMFEVAGDPDKIWNDIGDNGEHNLALLMFHPNGMRNYIQNWEEIIGPLMKRLRKEAFSSNDEILIEHFLTLQQHIDQRYLDMSDTDDELSVILPIKFGTPELTLNLYSIISTFGTAQDITANELRIEAFYPCDSITTKFFSE